MTQRVIILMLGHRSLTGKDTSAEYLKRFGWQRMAFADKLKSTVADLYNFTHDQMHGDLKDIEDSRYKNTLDEPYKFGYDDTTGEVLTWVPNDNYKPAFTPRRILQLFGQQQRLIYPDIWAQYIFNQIDIQRELSSNPSQIFKYVITDFRFKNEFEVAKRWAQTDVDNPEGHGKVQKCVIPIKVDRNVVAKSGSQDISEHDLDNFSDWCGLIDNNGTIDDLHDRLARLDNTFLKIILPSVAAEIMEEFK
jgi:hypothetical protein